LIAIVGLVLVLPASAAAGWCDDGTFPGELRQGIWRNTRVQVPAGTTGDVTLLAARHLLQTGSSRSTCNGTDVWEQALP
jgi:hypothetical protein